ncbi:MAG: Mut7-C RNAse domain-containing protein [Thermodesulfobacteriota bacterium]
MTNKYFQTFRECPACSRVYWAGCHHERMRERLRLFGIIAE